MSRARDLIESISEDSRNPKDVAFELRRLGGKLLQAAMYGKSSDYSRTEKMVDAEAKQIIAGLDKDAIKEVEKELKKMESSNEIDIVGAMYDVESGKVEFFDSEI